MNNDFEKLKEIYKSIYDVTVEINSLAELGDLDMISQVLDKRGFFIGEADKIIQNMNLSEQEKAEINSFIKKIKLTEEDNLKKMQDKHNSIEKELSQININKKVISAYKVNKQVDPRLIDSRE